MTELFGASAPFVQFLLMMLVLCAVLWALDRV